MLIHIPYLFQSKPPIAIQLGFSVLTVMGQCVLTHQYWTSSNRMSLDTDYKKTSVLIGRALTGRVWKVTTQRALIVKVWTGRALTRRVWTGRDLRKSLDKQSSERKSSNRKCSDRTVQEGFRQEKLYREELAYLSSLSTIRGWTASIQKQLGS